MNIGNENINHIKEGQKVKINFLALNYRQYGIAEGIIKNVYTDCINNDKMEYRVEVLVKEKQLLNSNGKIGLIKAGMLAECKVIIKEITILNLIMEKLNFKFNVDIEV